MSLIEPMGKLSGTATIVNELGLHARSAAKIAALAQSAGDGVSIEAFGQIVDAKSPVDILTLGCPRGTRMTVRVTTEKDRAVLGAIVALIENGFEE